MNFTIKRVNCMGRYRYDVKVPSCVSHCKTYLEMSAWMYDSGIVHSLIGIDTLRMSKKDVELFLLKW
jgi:hypothetical protein